MTIFPFNFFQYLTGIDYSSRWIGADGKFGEITFEDTPNVSVEIFGDIKGDGDNVAFSMALPSGSFMPSPLDDYSYRFASSGKLTGSMGDLISYSFSFSGALTENGDSLYSRYNLSSGQVFFSVLDNPDYRFSSSGLATGVSIDNQDIRFSLSSGSLEQPLRDNSVITYLFITGTYVSGSAKTSSALTDSAAMTYVLVTGTYDGVQE